MNKLLYFKIGELAQKTGLGVGNLRYYSDLGLLNPIKRGDNGYRYYNGDSIQQVEFIKKAQTIGFTLDEIKQILNVRHQGKTPCDLVKALLNSKIGELELKIQQMTLFKAELEEYRQDWENYSPLNFDMQEVCPLISTVSLKGQRAK